MYICFKTIPRCQAVIYIHSDPTSEHRKHTLKLNIDKPLKKNRWFPTLAA